mmetsp:Transcript_26016/g.60736  ORF Transcript_26016/g.60736 Transcript_26016/m.60736 type:complete len:276 (-) Transcript_26016:188-1015(-)
MRFTVQRKISKLAPIGDISLRILTRVDVCSELVAPSEVGLETCIAACRDLAGVGQVVATRRFPLAEWLEIVACRAITCVAELEFAIRLPRDSLLIERDVHAVLEERKRVVEPRLGDKPAWGNDVAQKIQATVHFVRADACFFNALDSKVPVIVAVGCTWQLGLPMQLPIVTRLHIISVTCEEVFEAIVNMDGAAHVAVKRKVHFARVLVLLNASRAVALAANGAVLHLYFGDARCARSDDGADQHEEQTDTDHHTDHLPRHQQWMAGLEPLLAEW